MVIKETGACTASGTTLWLKDVRMICRPPKATLCGS